LVLFSPSWILVRVVVEGHALRCTVRERRIHALRCAGSAQILREANVPRCVGVVQIRGADASRSVVQGTEMLMREAVLVEETVVGEHRDIISESSRWNLMAAAHKKQRLGHGFGIARGAMEPATVS
jgi:hypothetical protein